MIRLTMLLIFISLTVYSQDTDDRHKLVLEKGIVDSLFVFDLTKKVTFKTTKNVIDTLTDYNRIELKYLGSITTTHAQTFKIITSKRIWGISGRGTSRILIYNNKNQYVGQYYVGMTYDLPTKLNNGILIFDADTWGNCDKGIRLRLNLKKGLPEEFFLPCRGNSGDFYRFN